MLHRYLQRRQIGVLAQKIVAVHSYTGLYGAISARSLIKSHGTMDPRIGYLYYKRQNISSVL